MDLFRGAFYISKIYARTLFNIKSNVRIKVSFKMMGKGEEESGLGKVFNL